MGSVDNHIKWIDGAKGVAILCVILEHCLPDLDATYSLMHIQQAIPVFVFLTAYLITLKFSSINEYFNVSHIKKIITKMVPPFMLVTICEFIVYLIHTGHVYSIKQVLLSGGCLGPGSYYLCMYMMLWIIIPFIAWTVKKLPLWASFSVMLIVSILCEYAVTLCETIPYIEQLYRLTPIRYIMVVWLGCAAHSFNIKANRVVMIMATMSGIALLYTCYFAEIQHFAYTPPLLERKTLVYGIILYFAYYFTSENTIFRSVYMDGQA